MGVLLQLRSEDNNSQSDADMNEGRTTAYTDSRQNKYYILEDDSWWFSYRAKVFCHLIKKYMYTDKEIYDIGGSNGYNTIKIQESGYSATLMEPTEVACKNARNRGVNKVINLTLQEYNGEIEQFVCLDVIEHIKEDREFAKDLYDKCVEGSTGLIAVPAFKRLWSSEDEVDGHFRRYTEKSFTSIVLDAGFEVLYSGYCFKCLFIPIYIRRHLMEKLHLVHTVPDRSIKEEDDVTNRQFLNPKGLLGLTLNAILEKEYKNIVRGRRIRYGSSYLCVVRK